MDAHLRISEDSGIGSKQGERINSDGPQADTAIKQAPDTGDPIPVT
jgi:hypothetical protein